MESHGAFMIRALFTALAVPLVVPRPLPDKNELANSCYFTYKVGYIICDSGLSGEDAMRQMEAGQCNGDFRLMGSDFQRRTVQYYRFGGRPPLEEAMWILSSPENFQVRTLKECSAMQVIGYLLVAEAKLPLHGPSGSGIAAELALKALEQAQQTPTDVYAALERAWPMEDAFAQFQATAYRLRTLVNARSGDGDSGAPHRPYRVQFVVCRCKESLDWLADHVPPDGTGTLFVYDTCEDVDNSGSFDGGAASWASGFGAVYSQLAVEAAGSRSECSSRGVLEHLARVATEAEASELGHGSRPTFVAFLPAAPPPEDGPERRLIGLVTQSLAQRTLDADFVPLGFQRSQPKAASRPGAACERSVWRGAFGLGIPKGYEGARFVVSGERLLTRPAAHYQALLGALQTPPDACKEHPETLREVFSAAWHAVFGEALHAPLRADDTNLPLFLRFADGPSGFWRTRLPKASTYLASAEALGTR